jgi:hypothetical protein
MIWNLLQSPERILKEFPMTSALGVEVEQSLQRIWKILGNLPRGF